jgi:hypothetical protein
MVDPGGLVFCVIPPHTPDFDEQATVWPCPGVAQIAVSSRRVRQGFRGAIR